MHRVAFAWLCSTFLGIATIPRDACGQFMEEEAVQAAAAVLRETMATPMSQIPQAMLANAYGVAIIPKVIKGSFIVGARHGRGILFVRESDGVWHAPVFITLTGGNVGWQVGVQSSDIILVFKTLKSVQGILSGKLTLGADAAAAAGPLGRQAAIATDGRLQAEIYTYSRSRGLFAGVSIDGSVVQVDRLATGAYYRSTDSGKTAVVPPAAQQLTQTIAAITGSAAPASVLPQQPTLALQHGVSEADALRGELAQISPNLFNILDEQWRTYLALPANLFVEGSRPDAGSLSAVLQHYDSVAGDPRYLALAARPEFQSVYALLKHYQQSLTQSSARLELPAPPSTGAILPP